MSIQATQQLMPTVNRCLQRVGFLHYSSEALTCLAHVFRDLRGACELPPCLARQCLGQTIYLSAPLPSVREDGLSGVPFGPGFCSFPEVPEAEKQAVLAYNDVCGISNCSTRNYNYIYDDLGVMTSRFVADYCASFGRLVGNTK